MLKQTLSGALLTACALLSSAENAACGWKLYPLAEKLFAQCGHDNTENVTVGWKLYPLAEKLFARYERDTGERAPELNVANYGGSNPNMLGPDGKPTLGYFTFDEACGDGLVSTPVASKGYLFYANNHNPFVEKLDQVEIPPDLLRKIWFEGTTWEELTGSNDKGKTSIMAIAPDDAFLTLMGKCPAQESKVPRLGGDAGFKLAGQNEFSLAACDFDLIADEVIAKDAFYGAFVEPLRFYRLPNGNYKLERFGTAGGRGARLQKDQFGGIVVDGHFLRRNLVLRTKPGQGVELGKALAKTADELGMEELIKFAAYPLKVEFPQKQVNDRRFVFAHAMPCFLIGGIPKGFAHSYPPDAKTEKFAHWPPAAGPGVRTWWSERLTPHVNEQTISSARMDLDCAEQAGLDALGLLVYPGCLSPDNPWNKGLRLMMEAARTHKVKVMFDLWGTFPPSWSREAIELYTAEHGKRLKAWMDEFPEAFLKINGKIALSFGRDMTQWGQNADYYEKFFEALGGRDKYYLVVTLMDSRAHNVFNGWEKFGDLSTMWFVHTGWGDKVLDYVLSPLKARGEKTCWGVSPGYYRANFNDMKPDAGCVTEGYGACKLADDWRDAIRRGAGAVYVQSWNDMGEDHHILESNFRGDTFIQINRYFADWFRTGKAPEIEKEKILLFHRRHLKDAALEGKTGGLADNPSWSSAPITDYVEVVTMLKNPGDVKVKLGAREFMLKDVQPGLHEWLLLVPVKKDHKGNMPYWNKGSYKVTRPFDTDFRKVTELDKLEACVPEATVSRGGKEMLKVVSRTGLPDKFKFQTLSVVGSVSE